MNRYCVVLRPQPTVIPAYPRAKRYYLRAKSAVQAMLIVSEDPAWLVVGVEPACMFPPRPETDTAGIVYHN
jgi:hypothetical protein